MVRWLRWHCPPDTGFEIRALAVWGRARYLSVTEAPHNTNFHTWMGKKQFCFFQTAETGNRTPDSGVKGSGANHYPRAPAQFDLVGEITWKVFHVSSLNLLCMLLVTSSRTSSIMADKKFKWPIYCDFSHFTSIIWPCGRNNMNIFACILPKFVVHVTNDQFSNKLDNVWKKN